MKLFSEKYCLRNSTEPAMSPDDHQAFKVWLSAILQASDATKWKKAVVIGLMLHHAKDADKSEDACRKIAERLMFLQYPAQARMTEHYYQLILKTCLDRRWTFDRLDNDFRLYLVHSRRIRLFRLRGNPLGKLAQDLSDRGLNTWAIPLSDKLAICPAQFAESLPLNDHDVAVAYADFSDGIEHQIAVQFDLTGDKTQFEAWRECGLVLFEYEAPTLRAFQSTDLVMFAGGPINKNEAYYVAVYSARYQCADAEARSWYQLIRCQVSKGASGELQLDLGGLMKTTPSLTPNCLLGSLILNGQRQCVGMVAQVWTEGYANIDYIWFEDLAKIPECRESLGLADPNKEVMGLNELKAFLSTPDFPVEALIEASDIYFKNAKDVEEMKPKNTLVVWRRPAKSSAAADMANQLHAMSFADFIKICENLLASSPSHGIRSLQDADQRYELMRLVIEYTRVIADEWWDANLRRLQLDTQTVMWVTEYPYRAILEAQLARRGRRMGGQLMKRDLNVRTSEANLATFEFCPDMILPMPPTAGSEVSSVDNLVDQTISHLTELVEFDLPLNPTEQDVDGYVEDLLAEEAADDRIYVLLVEFPKHKEPPMVYYDKLSKLRERFPRLFCVCFTGDKRSRKGQALHLGLLKIWAKWEECLKGQRLNSNAAAITQGNANAH